MFIYLSLVRLLESVVDEAIGFLLRIVEIETILCLFNLFHVPDVCFLRPKRVQHNPVLKSFRPSIESKFKLN